MVENQERVAAARVGIEIDAHVFLSETQQELRVDAFHQVAASLAETQRALRSEAVVAEAVHERYREVAAEQARDDEAYQRYIKQG